MFKITLRKQSPLALHCLDMAPKDRNAELIRLADLGLAIERLGIGGSNSAHHDRNSVHQPKVGHHQTVTKPSVVENAADRSEQRFEGRSEIVDFADDIFQVGS